MVGLLVGGNLACDAGGPRAWPILGWAVVAAGGRARMADNPRGRLPVDQRTRAGRVRRQLSSPGAVPAALGRAADSERRPGSGPVLRPATGRTGRAAWRRSSGPTELGRPAGGERAPRLLKTTIPAPPNGFWTHRPPSLACARRWPPFSVLGQCAPGVTAVEGPWTKRAAVLPTNLANLKPGAPAGDGGTARRCPCPSRHWA